MAKKNNGLGRGLDAIFLDNTLFEESENRKSAERIRVSLVDPNKDQPRKSFDKEALEELSASIKEHGLLQPIIVREYGDSRYQIIAGERRFRASKLAGLTEIPAIIIDADDKKVAELSLIENIQREDLNPVEEALGYRALSRDFAMTQDEISKRTGKSRSAVANTMRLLDLQREVLDFVASGALSAGHARTLLGLKNELDIFPLASAAIKDGMSVRELEAAVKRYNRKKAEEPSEEAPLPIVDYFKELELRVQRTLGRRCKIEEKGKKKSLTLFYEDNEDLDELLTSICGKDFLNEF
ncbi:MAG: ParB/RepB/Spo0J family partition protein [Clostridia bacterium]|nr:ParB/RepB/Spo0J family partition protein [Clostridia bacterium]